MSEVTKIIKGKDSGELFSNYIDIKELGTNIFNSLKKLYVDKKGYPIDTNYNADKFGIISNTMALSTIIELHSMDVDITNFDKEMFKLLEMIMNSVVSETRYIYDASPYIFNGNSNEKNIASYVETIAKIIIVMTDMRTLLIDRILDNVNFNVKFIMRGRSITSYADLLAQVEDLLINSIQTANRACLKAREQKAFMINGKTIERYKLDPKIAFRGWSFQVPLEGEDDAYDTSIYFTYHATNAFLSFYQEFTEFFDYEFEKKPYHTITEGAGNLKRKKFEINKQFFYNNYKVIEEFRSKAISSGRYVDTKLRENGVDLAFDYIKNDFTPISVTSILDSQKNNYAIDTLFTLALLINAGIDDDYNEAGQIDYFYDQLQYSMMNVKKVYSIMKKNNKEDLIASYRLTFNERCPLDYKGLIQEFRKKCANIAVYDLVPLLCNTNAIISKFLVRYPQKEMVDNLELIIENQSAECKWLWDKDGYGANNNLYYIFAIENFYEYYETFELPLSKNGKEYNKAAKLAEEERNLKSHDFAELQSKYEELEKKLDDKKSALDTEVYNIAERAFENKIHDGINKYFNEMIQDCYRFLIKTQQLETLEDNVLDGYSKAELLLKMSFAMNLPKVINKAGDIANYADEERKLSDVDRKVKDEILNIIEASKMSK